jgi:hypothetical protein
MSKKSKLNVATAIAVLTTAIAVLGLSSQAFTLGGGLGLNGEFGGVRAASGFHSSAFVSAPPPVFNTPAPVFNPSESYPLPQSPEIPVSPASPGSVFGNG